MNSTPGSPIFSLLLLALLTLPLSEGRCQEPAPVAHVEYVPQRLDDIAWENDRIAFRIYGPALEKKEPTGSGIDVWVKSVRKPVISSRYKLGDYHKDHGDGLDFYEVGKSRGCGGLGIWDGQKLYVSGHWATYQILETDGPKSAFKVSYAPWAINDGKSISEDRKITLDAGSNLNRIESSFSGDLKNFVAGIGIAKRKGGDLYEDRERGILAYWQPASAENGVIGCAVLVDPKSLVDFASDDLNNLVLVKAGTSTPLVYRAGACWSKGLDFKTFEEWKKYLVAQSALK